jgi:hypothetical protein
VVTVSAEVTAVVLLIETEVGERLHVVELTTAVGAATAQVSVTVPVNELPGVTVMVEVPVALWPTVMLLGLLERVKLVLPPPGACQKSPQPTRKPASTGAVASNNKRSHLPIFISTPLMCVS